MKKIVAKLKIVLINKKKLQEGERKQEWILCWVKLCLGRNVEDMAIGYTYRHSLLNIYCTDKMFISSFSSIFSAIRQIKHEVV